MTEKHTFSDNMETVWSILLLFVNPVGKKDTPLASIDDVIADFHGFKV